MSTPPRSKTRHATPSSSSATRNGDGRLFTESDEVHLLKTLEKLTKSTPPSSQISPEREEVVNLEAYPVLVGELSEYFPLNLVWREALRSLGSGKLREMDEKWKSIRIEEAEIVIKKAELAKEQTDLIMEVLGDSANGNCQGKWKF
ncbi:hypothetical protein Pint_31447 [Pistacia integerrima]|uniref:Uncharacterized protein n=1 Tax=Pistacia integerrima TaxID=434235 RepID=A0ACC0XQK6_9ROSI|nr:hypothetical protein Pint_31447 [Pistacia integerrima]